MTRGKLELLNDINDFTTLLFYDILSSEWFRVVYRSGLGMRFAIWSLELFTISLPSHTLSSVREDIENSISLAYFRNSGKRNFYSGASACEVRQRSTMGKKNW